MAQTDRRRFLQCTAGCLAAGSTGLFDALSLAADANGGQVEARSEGSGRGSEFVVRLPRIPPAKAIDSQSVLRVVGNVSSAR